MLFFFLHIKIISWHFSKFRFLCCFGLNRKKYKLKIINTKLKKCHREKKYFIFLRAVVTNYVIKEIIQGNEKSYLKKKEEKKVNNGGIIIR